ncbi:hypothetical protein DL93DRAFT_118888 [Clavulina sp. PMI_390]|nr:hypothetical protein DL93DRAFT_118888 [Clavulina sp. PMI_390]
MKLVELKILPYSNFLLWMALLGGHQAPGLVFGLNAALRRAIGLKSLTLRVLVVKLVYLAVHVPHQEHLHSSQQGSSTLYPRASPFRFGEYLLSQLPLLLHIVEDFNIKSFAKRNTLHSISCLN